MKNFQFSEGLRRITFVLLVVLAILQQVNDCLTHINEILLSICNILKQMFT